MTSATDGGVAHSGDGDIELTAVSGAAEPTSRRWWAAWPWAAWPWAALVAVLAVAAVVVWQSGGGGEPSALVTATDVSTSGVTETDAPSTTSGEVSDAVSAPADPIDTGSTDVAVTGPATTLRPVVPVSTTTAPPVRTTVVTAVPSTIVVSPTPDATAPRVSLVDDAVTEAVVIDPVPNTSLNAADRTVVTPTASTTSVPRLDCDGPPVRLDATALADSGGLSAEGANGAAATITTSGQGIGVLGGRDDARIDYSAERGASERVVIELGGLRCAVDVEVDDLASSEWNGVDESVHWIGLGSDNRTVGEGWLLGSADRPFDLPLTEPIERLLLEAAPYGATAAGWPPGADRETNDNSDFVLLAVVVR